jgi:CHAT domain-containing protein
MVDATDPLESRLLLADGAAGIRVADILELPAAPSLVVLAACDTASETTGSAEASSLASAFLAVGARQVLGTLWPVTDQVAAELSARIHSQLARGRNAADALRSVQAEAMTDVPAWSSFVAYGSFESEVPEDTP